MQQTPEQAPELLDTFRGLLLTGRWLMLLAVAAGAAVLWATRPLDQAALPAIGLLFLYTAVSAAVFHSVSIRKIPVLVLLGLDLALIAAVAWRTGGTASPFLGL